MIWVPCGGCLVTDEFHFQAEPNLPPVFVNRPGEPEIGEHIWIDNSVQSQRRLGVRIRDENVEQELELHWRIRQDREMVPEWAAVPVPTASGNPERDVDIFINADRLPRYTCQRLELVVSGSFIPELIEPEYFAFVVPEDRSDRGFALWWIWEGEGIDTPDQNWLQIAKSCPALDLPATDTVAGGME